MDELLRWSILNSTTENKGNADRKTQPLAQNSSLDPGIVDAILGKNDAVQMQENLAVILSQETSLEEKEVAFENFELLIGQIDNAKSKHCVKHTL